MQESLLTTGPGVNEKPGKEDKDWIESLVGALCDPIIVYPSPWKEDIPDWIFSQIKLERLVMNMKVLREGCGVPVGDTECLAYIFPRTMDAPMTDQQNRLYMYVFNQAMKFKKTEVPEDLKSETLGEYDMHQLGDLKRFIYAKRVQHRKEKARGERQEARQAEVATVRSERTVEKKLEVKAVQPKFF